MACRVDDASAALVEAVATEQTIGIDDFPAGSAAYLLLGTRVVPDAGLVERAGEEPGCRACRIQSGAERRGLNAVRAWRLTDDDRSIRHAVQVQLQRRPVV